LLNDTIIEPFTINYSASGYVLQQEDYICYFDGEKATGFYDIRDKNLKNNLIDESNEKMDSLELVTKTFVADYFDRIINKKLGNPNKK
jgi:hypothetical protein